MLKVQSNSARIRYRKSKAQTELLSAPGDESLRQMLGVAAFDSGDYTTAAQSFDKVGTIGKQFQPIAARSFARAAVDVATQDPAQSLAYAQKAVALDQSTNSKYALGQAQLANKQYSDAIATLKAVRTAAFADPKTPTTAKVAIDSALMNAYLQTNDSQDVQSIAAEIKQLDPMKSYDWAWVEMQVDQTVNVWHDSAGVSVPPARRYSLEEQRVNEEAYDEALLEVEEALRPPPISGKEQTLTQDRIVASFARFSANALGLDTKATELLTSGFLPVGTSLARWARRFDPDLSMTGIIQAARNAWTACGLQPLLGVPFGPPQ